VSTARLDMVASVFVLRWSIGFKELVQVVSLHQKATSAVSDFRRQVRSC
jgi:hypothetical protein